jgi:hypothetical protein
MGCIGGIGNVGDQDHGGRAKGREGNGDVECGHDAPDRTWEGWVLAVGAWLVVNPAAVLVSPAELVEANPVVALVAV